MTVTLPPEAVSGQPTAMHFSEPVPVIHKRGNVRADSVRAGLDNDWIGCAGDL